MIFNDLEGFMDDSKKIKVFAETFRNMLSPMVRKGTSIAYEAFPVNGPGGILVFKLGPGSKDSVHPPEKSIGSVLGKIPQRAFAGNLEGIKFGGTNLILENNSIVLIKGEDADTEWGIDGIRNDFGRVWSAINSGVANARQK